MAKYGTVKYGTVKYGSRNPPIYTLSYNGEIYGDEISSDGGGLEMTHAMVGETLSVDTLTAPIITRDLPVRLLGLGQGTNDFIFDSNGKIVCVRGGALTPDFVRNGTGELFFRTDRVGRYFANSLAQTGPYANTLSMYSAIWLLEQSYHYGNMYTGEAAGDVIADIIGNVVTYTIDADVAAIEVYQYLPYAKKRSNLQFVLMAIGASIRNNSDGSLRITTLSAAASGTFGASRVFFGGSVVDKTPATAVQVTEHNYVASEDTATLYDNTTVLTETITFKEPYHDLAITGGTIVSSGVNYCTFTGAGAVTITGKKYTHITRVITVGTTPTGSYTDNVKTVTNNTLLGPINAEQVAENLYSYLSVAKSIKQEVVFGTERPGDVVNVIHPYSRELASGCVKTMSLSFGYTELRAVSEFLVGYIPSGAVSGFTHYAILADAGTYTVPAGVTRIRAIISGAGDGGGAGANGADSVPGTSGQGGAGGTAGIAGTGALIFEINLNVTPGDTISYASGAGGTSGAPGGATTFGAYSSASGRRYPYGYYEPKSGLTLAADGTAGVSGGKGRDYGQVGINVTYNGVTYTPGENGADHEPYYGGGGGGAAAGNNGGVGGDAHYIQGWGWVNGTGGTGASAAAIANATSIGTGGDGGHGGGGGGYAKKANPLNPGIGGSGSVGGQGGPGGIIIYY